MPTMEPTAITRARLDAPFWGFLLLALIALGSLGCFGLAAAYASSPGDAAILTTDDCPAPSDL